MIAADIAVENRLATFTLGTANQTLLTLVGWKFIQLLPNFFRLLGGGGTNGP